MAYWPVTAEVGTSLHMSGFPGAFDRSMQHHLM